MGKILFSAKCAKKVVLNRFRGWPWPIWAPLGPLLHCHKIQVANLCFRFLKQKFLGSRVSTVNCGLVFYNYVIDLHVYTNSKISRKMREPNQFVRCIHVRYSGASCTIKIGKVIFISIFQTTQSDNILSTAEGWTTNQLTRTASSSK